MVRYKIRPTKLNLLHNKIRTADALELENARDIYFKMYRQAGGKRDLRTLLITKPIYLKGGK